MPWGELLHVVSNLVPGQPAGESQTIFEVPSEADISGGQVARALVVPLPDLDLIRGAVDGIVAGVRLTWSVGAVGQAPLLALVPQRAECRRPAPGLGEEMTSEATRVGPQLRSDLVECLVLTECPCRLHQGPEMVGQPLVTADSSP